MRRIFLAASILGVLAILLAPAGAAAPAHPPAPVVAAPGPPVLPGVPGAAGIHPSAAPPPFDWDPMWFNAPNSTGVAGAGGAGAQMAVDDNRGIAIMFGGATPSQGVANTTWLVNQTTARWSRLTTPVAPSPRRDFSLASAPNCGVAVLFGGVVNSASQQVTNDTWLFNFTSLTWRNISATVGPAPRQGAALAIDDRSCTAVLFGGVDFDYRSGNSTGNVRWNDTWVLALANDSWREIATVNTPPSLTDAGFLYDNASRIFLLYGGCDSLCSPTIWQFSRSDAQWSARAQPSFDPPGRGGAGWVYSPTYDVAVLSMGYLLQGNQVVPLNDTYVYEIGLNRFDPVGPPTPSPRFDAASGWLGANGCPGFLLVGGAGAPTDPPDQWFLDPAPDIPLACNTWGNDSISIGGGGFGCDTGFNLTVNVTALGGAPLAGANVTVGGNCSTSYRITGPSGLAYFDLSYQPYLVIARAAGYHPNSTPFQAVNTSVAGSVNLTLTSLPTLRLQSWELPITGPPVPLGNVTITSVSGVPIGETNASGRLVLPNFEPTGEFYTFLGSRTGFSDGATTSRIPYTGNWSVNVTLLGPGPIDVQVLEAGSGAPLPAALVTVHTVATEAPAGFQRRSNPDGWANATVPAGNFTATAQLAGYAVLAFVPPFYHGWRATTVVRINMTSAAGYTVDVRVLDRTDGHPIPGSTVAIGLYPPSPTLASGWMNLSGIKPAGTYGVSASAPNYTTNRTSVGLSYERPIWVFTLNLTPLTSCSSDHPGPNCTRTPLPGTSVQPLSLWPTSPPSAAALAAGGALLFLVPAAFLFLARRRPRQVAGEGPKP